MLINDSQDRHKELQSLLREELNFNPRAREDLDAIVTFAQGSKIGALKPALRYHFASHLPVYTTSQTLRTLPTRQYSKINGFHVTEMPWKLKTDALANSINQGFGQLGSSQNSLQALGVDALRLSLQLQILRNNPEQLVSGS
jgi:outer membrane PBP1 activator LpoA protein